MDRLWHWLWNHCPGLRDTTSAPAENAMPRGTASSVVFRVWSQWCGNVLCAEDTVLIMFWWPGNQSRQWKKTHHFEMVFPLETSIFSVRGFPATELMTPFRLTAKLVVWQCLEPMFDLTDLDIQRKHLKLPVDFCGGAPRKWRGTPDFHHPFWTMGFSTRNTIQLVGNPHVYPLIHIIWGRIPVAGSLAEAYESSEIKCWRRIIRYYQ